MEKNIEFVLKELSMSNIKQVERDTGVPATRIYKWLKKKGNPKANDLEIMLNYFQKEKKLLSNENVTYKENVNQKLIEATQYEHDKILHNPKNFNEYANEHLGYGKKTRNKDDEYTSLEQLIDRQQEQILQLLTSTRLLKDQLQLIKNLQ